MTATTTRTSGAPTPTASRPKALTRLGNRLLLDPTLGVITLLLLVCVVSFFVLPEFLTATNLENLLSGSLIVMILAPYIDKNPSNKPEDRKFATSLMTVHLMFWAVLVIIGSFFRGPGFNFTLPWRDGIFFEL